ncbi:hypothetical protein ANOM_011651 [Aspergillus nomiae NRRL 13137]|uniref:Uncharacterized protein n=1 Tax=Aspergillus nomiae NRRL (strain ATCC 15546 / NRRL 13137 / CBS 260.88 / M93) TaxID=1509407 RepID=A0A0L1IL34_ASPN3|nr:uncharacterized protein ANOM_011651 [Aspergillus nomiae NRRL 13137]KNG79960.1 hypothetical protein ANOM_011651 [Aspergillus nomiae NRRL 13137]
MDEEIWDFDCTGSVMRFDDKELKLNEQLTEVLDDRMGQRHVLAFADDIKTEERYLVKIRYDDAGYGPKYVAHWGQFQGSGWPFYGGAVFFLVMGTVPGEDVDEIRDELSDRQLDNIRSQLARILELMRTNGYKLYEQHPSFLRYDKVADKLYLVELTFIGFTDPNSETSIPVTQDNVYVEAFNIWRYPYEEPPQAPQSPLSTQSLYPAQSQDRSKENAPPDTRSPREPEQASSSKLPHRPAGDRGRVERKRPPRNYGGRR